MTGGGWQATAVPLIYLASAVMFFLGLGALSKLRSAARGVPLLLTGVGLALVGALIEIGPGAFFAAFPLLAVGGAAGVLVAWLLLRSPGTTAPVSAAGLALVPAVSGVAAALVAADLLAAGSSSIGGLRVAGAGIALLLGAAAAALGAPLATTGRETSRTTGAAALSVLLAGAAITVLGLVLSQVLVIIVGTVSATAGLALGRAAARAAEQPLLRLLLGAPTVASRHGYEHVRSCTPEEAAALLESARQVVIIPGYGLAVAQAQHAVKEAAELLVKKGAQVTFVVHPSAGRMPGHMNIVLDEADVARDRVLDLDGAGAVLRAADAVLIVGANDVVNPAALDDSQSAVFGMDVPDLRGVRTVLVIKRSLRTGAAGVANRLLEQPNTAVIFGDAKKVAQGLVAELKRAGAGAH